MYSVKNQKNFFRGCFSSFSPLFIVFVLFYRITGHMVIFMYHFVMFSANRREILCVHSSWWIILQVNDVMHNQILYSNSSFALAHLAFKNYHGRLPGPSSSAKCNCYRTYALLHSLYTWCVLPSYLITSAVRVAVVPVCPEVPTVWPRCASYKLVHLSSRS